MNDFERTARELIEQAEKDMLKADTNGLLAAIAYSLLSITEELKNRFPAMNNR